MTVIRKTINNPYLDRNRLNDILYDLGASAIDYILNCNEVEAADGSKGLVHTGFEYYVTIPDDMDEDMITNVITILS